MSSNKKMTTEMKQGLDTLAKLLRRSEGYRIIRTSKGEYTVLVFLRGEPIHAAGGGKELTQRTIVHAFRGLRMDSKKQVENLLYVLREFEPESEEDEEKEEKTITYEPDVE